MLTISRYESAEQFAEAVMLSLLEHEAEHCLLIGTLGQTLADPRRWDRDPVMLSVNRAGVPMAVLQWVSPYSPVLSLIDDPAAIPLLVEALMTEADVRGVIGPVAAAEAFAAEWTMRTGQTAVVEMSERLFKIERVLPVAGVSGTGRRATVDDRPMLIEWVTDFVAEAFREPPPLRQVERSVDARLLGEQSGYVIWEDGEPVCLCGFSGPTPNGIRVAPVYTPPRFRGRGYGRATVAAASQQLLDEGRAFCALFTDLANPTSNYIYQLIGYEPVCDFSNIRFQ